MTSRARRSRPALALAIALFTVSMIAPCRAVADGPIVTFKATGDHDNDGDELLYHWQDKRFDVEEQQQTCGALILVAIALAGASTEKMLKKRRLAK